jgi:hypothetical protein
MVNTQLKIYDQNTNDICRREPGLSDWRGNRKIQNDELRSVDNDEDETPVPRVVGEWTQNWRVCRAAFNRSRLFLLTTSPAFAWLSELPLNKIAKYGL